MTITADKLTYSNDALQLINTFGWPGIPPYRKEDSAMRKIKVTHDGSLDVIKGTRITDVETGQDLEHVKRIEITFDADDRIPCAVVYLEAPALDIVVDVARACMLEYDPEDIDSIDQAIAHLQAERAERIRQ